jgi:hypothetical protein
LLCAREKLGKLLMGATRAETSGELVNTMFKGSSMEELFELAAAGEGGGSPKLGNARRLVDMVRELGKKAMLVVQDGAQAVDVDSEVPSPHVKLCSV